MYETMRFVACTQQVTGRLISLLFFYDCTNGYI